MRFKGFKTSSGKAKNGCHVAHSSKYLLRRRRRASSSRATLEAAPKKGATSLVQKTKHHSLAGPIYFAAMVGCSQPLILSAYCDRAHTAQVLPSLGPARDQPMTHFVHGVRARHHKGCRPSCTRLGPICLKRLSAFNYNMTASQRCKQ